MRINLYPLGQPAIIVKYPTGLIYSNQTNGVACNHPEQEGFLVPLFPLLGKESHLFDPGWWYEEMPALDASLYNQLEKVLNSRFEWHVRNLRVDRKAKNQEAWIHITFRGDFNPGMFSSGLFRRKDGSVPNWTDKIINYKDYPKYEGILTWENCD